MQFFFIFFLFKKIYLIIQHISNFKYTPVNFKQSFINLQITQYYNTLTSSNSILVTEHSCSNTYLPYICLGLVVVVTIIIIGCFFLQPPNNGDGGISCSNSSTSNNPTSDNGIVSCSNSSILNNPTSDNGAVSCSTPLPSNIIMEDLSLKKASSLLPEGAFNIPMLEPVPSLELVNSGDLQAELSLYKHLNQIFKHLIKEGVYPIITDDFLLYTSLPKEELIAHTPLVYIIHIWKAIQELPIANIIQDPFFPYKTVKIIIHQIPIRTIPLSKEATNYLMWKLRYIDYKILEDCIGWAQNPGYSALYELYCAGS
jgi:hypothetical protein